MADSMDFSKQQLTPTGTDKVLVVRSDTEYGHETLTDIVKEMVTDPITDPITTRVTLVEDAIGSEETGSESGILKRVKDNETNIATNAGNISALQSGLADTNTEVAKKANQETTYTKTEVDSKETALESEIAKKLPLTGGTLTGALYGADIGSATNPIANLFTKSFMIANGFASTSDEYKNAVKGLHNGLYRGACLYDGINSQAGIFSSIDELYNAVHNNDFSKIYTGDYADLTITSDYGTENVRLVATDPDYYWGRYGLATHHLPFVLEDALANTAQMNSGDTGATGGYAGSAMAKTVLPKYATAFSNALGGHIISTSHLVSNRTSTTAINQSGGHWTGAADYWGWNSYDIMLLSEVQVYGSLVWSQGFDIGDACQQLSYFKLRPDKLVCGNGYKATNRCTWWLSGVAGSTNFCNVNNNGNANYNNASNSNGVRPITVTVLCVGDFPIQSEQVRKAYPSHKGK